MDIPERFLPEALLQRASLRGTEYAWLIEDIPSVIAAAANANLANLGGQLQFRLPGATCECYWVQIEARSRDAVATWEDYVRDSAITATTEWKALLARSDFATEGRRAFKEVDRFASDGGDLNEVACFVWYLARDENGVPSEATRA